MTITVFHLKVSQDAMDEPEIKKAYFDIIAKADAAMIEDVFDALSEWRVKGLRYAPVAQVETNDLESAFGLTNHLDSPWTSNQGVTKIGDENVRSTSVGDVMRDDSGTLFYVAPFGFEPFESNAMSDRERSSRESIPGN